MAGAQSARTRSLQCLGAVLWAVGLCGCSSSGTVSHEGGAGGGGIQAGNPGGGVPGLGGAASTAGAAGVVEGTGGASGGSGLGIADAGAGGRDGAVVSGDGRLAGADGALPSERIGNDLRVSGDTTNARDAGADGRATDVSGPQVLDAAGDLRQADVPVGQDGAPTRDATAGEAAQDGLGVEQCQPSPPNPRLNIPDSLAAVTETQGLCQPPTDPYLVAEPGWGYAVPDGMKLYLVSAISCTESGDASVGGTSGVDRKQILYALQTTSTSPQRQRIFIASIEDGQSQVNAAYDIVYGSSSPGQPSVVRSLELVCGTPSSLSMFDGWTGRIGRYFIPLGSGQANNGALFIGSSASEQTPRLLFYVNQCNLGICGPPN